MPNMTITTRYNAQLYGKPDGEILNTHKQYVRKNFEPIGPIDSEIITEGDPDNLGMIDPVKEFAIRSKFEVTDEKVAELKRRNA